MSERDLPIPEPTVSATMLVLDAYLSNYEPDPDGSMLKTTDAILRDLDDMVELQANDVAAVLAERGYSIRYVGASGRHGWAMRPLA